jgi:hypothetical protein
MLTMVRLSGRALRDSRSMAALASFGARHELVLVGAQHLTGEGVLPALRRALPRHRLIALMVDGEVVAHERKLVEELLAEGSVPVILTPDDPAAEPTNWIWLGADATVSLPGETVANHTPWPDL